MNIESEFAQIFSEAQVIDIDFSKWDKFIRLVVIGLNYPAGDDNRSRLFNVDFSGVKEFTWRGHHIGITLDDANKHCQWTVMKYIITRTSSGYEVSLSDVSPPSPEITILCEDIQISAASWDVVFAVNPLWHGSHLPLARPSLDQILINR